MNIDEFKDDIIFFGLNSDLFLKWIFIQVFLFPDVDKTIPFNGFFLSTAERSIGVMFI